MTLGSLALIWGVPAFLGSALLTRYLIGWTQRIGVLDRPNERSSHTKVTPRGGGIGIVVITVGAAVAAAVGWPATWVSLAALLASSSAIAYVSWLDDLRPLQNRVRFGVHLISAVVVAAIVGPVRVVDAGWLGTLDLGIASWPLSVLWVVGMTNAFNFMDGIDGIAGITAASAGVAISVGAASLGYPAVAAVTAAFAAAAMGFLVWNWPPARVFMGDVGSAFCGFVIAVLPMLPGAEPGSRLVTIALFAMWPFIFDTIFTLIRRCLRGENVFEAHRSHLYQRLVIAGWPHWGASTLYGVLSVMASAISLVPFYDEAATATVTYVALMFLPFSAGLLVLLVRGVEGGGMQCLAEGQET